MGRDDGRPRLPTRHCCRTCGMPTLMHCTRASSASQTLPVPSHAPISLLVSTMTTRLCSSSVGGGAKGKRHGKRCGGGGGSSEHSRRAERARPATRPASTAGRRAATPTRTRQHACHLANHRCLAHARPAQEQHRVGDCRGGGGASVGSGPRRMGRGGELEGWFAASAAAVHPARRRRPAPSWGTPDVRCSFTHRPVCRESCRCGRSPPAQRDTSAPRWNPCGCGWLRMEGGGAGREGKRVSMKKCGRPGNAADQLQCRPHGVAHRAPARRRRCRHT